MTPTVFSKQRSALITSIIVLGFLILPLMVFAQTGGTGGTGSTGGTGVGGPTGGTGTTLQNPLNVNSFPQLIDRMFQAMLAVGVPIAVLFIVYAGFKLIMARGKPEKLTIAKTHLMYTLFGIALFIGASILVNLFIETLCQVDVRGIDQCN